MIRISWMLVSYLAAAIVIFAGPDQPEQAIDAERSSLTVHVGKAGLLSAAAHVALGQCTDRRRNHRRRRRQASRIVHCRRA